jgi:EAL domain-containing protein (putative c-di-GMP-specific phosphodiesterase class I)
MTAAPAQLSLQPAAAPPGAEPSAGLPLCYVVDADRSTRHFLSLILHGTGLDSQEFPDGRAVSMAVSQRAPDIIFLNIPLESADAIECVLALSRINYRGHVQLMSNRGSAVLAHVKSIGDQNRLQMLASLKKPFETNAILKILQDLKLGEPRALAGRVDIDEALEKKWFEFWYQPKIDLRKKQLVGVEAFARVRHPTSGILMPSAFIPGAREPSIATLSQLALAQALSASVNFGKLGVNLRLSVNIPLNALAKLPIEDIVKSYRPKFEKWPGLTIDIPEDQIIASPDQAAEIAKQLQPLDVRLAVDDFGRGYTSLARLKELPFAEFKLDRTLVTDAGSDKANAPLCKTVIDFAHGLGSIAVAVGIEKASAALALVAMGCDYGQGFLLGQPMPEERFISLLRQRTAASKKPALEATA